jgi:hypothetical protein
LFLGITGDSNRGKLSERLKLLILYLINEDILLENDIRKCKPASITTAHQANPAPDIV